ncbi:adenylyl-sulfate kinase [Paenibacillus paeoniae]|nr:adenylyl-sulfate kinase [Paenibacillus paeoniae]
MNRQEREYINGHRGGIYWFIGLSGSGKTTLALAAERELVTKHGMRCVVLDGDRLRKGLNRDLGFSDADRSENLRRAAEVAQLFLEQGFVVLVSMITPYESFRRKLKQQFASDDYAEIYVMCSLAACERRDPKGLYRKARAGDIPNFTGINALFEPPVQPDLTIHTDGNEFNACIAELVTFIEIHATQKSDERKDEV